MVWGVCNCCPIFICGKSTSCVENWLEEKVSHFAVGTPQLGTNSFPTPAHPLQYCKYPRYSIFVFFSPDGGYPCDELALPLYCFFLPPHHS